ncbi:MAG: ADP-glyceromanno-heptose 6-epimerase [Rhodospirillaceae bacterium]|jgi:ADP-L-glycero-D-manno-heptose 6-epimerase|nr:ADP-glyceromanno-heptose 6-epimerase [Rhodospirillaceae bacterium]MBT5660323.1 ADP-glyceromanno-heptose 6-epimerase [Rhodospirillaceae bacterium]MBT5751975.1 ADP-glyceromanno-heptose 6-epimerase [Rhodospirillaceae bacterium]
MFLITGGAGFIGSNLAAALEKRGESEIIVCDWLEDGDKWRNLAKRELADIVPPEDLFEFLQDNADAIHTVFHMGAISSTTETDADLVIETNFSLSLALWEWCRQENTRFIYASSAATYGDGSAGFNDDPSPEAMAKLQPLNVYGWSKHLFDRRVLRMANEAGNCPPQWAGLKFFNVYGPNEEHKEGMKSVAAQVFPFAKEDKTFRLFKSHHPDYADGGQLRDFVSVDDCVDVMMWLLDNPEVNGLFNLGTGKARSFAELASAVYAALGKKPQIDYIDTPEELRDKYQYFTQADMTRLRKAGYDRPFTSLEDGIGNYVRDFLDTSDPYR